MDEIKYFSVNILILEYKFFKIEHKIITSNNILSNIKKNQKNKSIFLKINTNIIYIQLYKYLLKKNKITI